MSHMKIRGLSAIHVLGILVVGSIVALLMFGETDSQKRERLGGAVQTETKSEDKLITGTSYVELSGKHKKELVVFFGRASGNPVSVTDVDKVPATEGIHKLVSAGLNLNRFLCAQITDIRPLKVPGAYEVTCIANRGGSAKKAYLVDALKGIASEM